MKKIIYASILIFSMALLASCETIEGNGIITTQSKSVNNFDKIDISIPAHIAYHINNNPSITISADQNILEYIDISVYNNELEIKVKGDYNYNINPSNDISITINGPLLRGIELNSGTTFNANQNIAQDSLHINISGSANLNLPSINNSFFKADISGLGKFKINELLTKNVQFDISGSSFLNADNIYADDVIIQSSGKSDVNIYSGKILKGKYESAGVSSFMMNNVITDTAYIVCAGKSTYDIHIAKYLNIEVSGKSDITLHGTPTIVKDVAGKLNLHPSTSTND